MKPIDRVYAQSVAIGALGLIMASALALQIHAPAYLVPLGGLGPGYAWFNGHIRQAQIEEGVIKE